jgi:nucleoside-diphosphate kinase
MGLHEKVLPIRYQRTFVMIKPDGVKRGIVGDILGRFERAGLKIVAMKMLQATEEQVEKHYPVSDEAWAARIGKKNLESFKDLGIDAVEVMGTTDEMAVGKTVIDALKSYITSGPVVPIIIEGPQAVAMVRKIVGSTMPIEADLGTIRGDYSVDSPIVANAEGRPMHNLIHASGNIEEALQEIAVWFSKEEQEMANYNRVADEIMYSKHY